MRDQSAQVGVRTLPAYRSCPRVRSYQIGTWIFVSLLCLAATAYSADARAQSPPPTLVVMPLVQVKSSGQIPFAVIAGPPEALPPNSLIRIRGLPEGVTPSESYRGAAGSWDVPLSAALRLKLNVPAGLSGRRDFVVTLVDGRGTVLAESPSALVMDVVASGSVEADKAMEHAKLAEIRRADEAREAERTKADELRLAAVVKRAEEMRLEVEKMESALKDEEARKLAEAKAEEARRVEEAERLARAEEAIKVAQARKLEEARKAAEVNQARMAEEQARKRAEAAAEEARKVEEAERLARAEEARKVAQARKLEEARKAAEAKQARMVAEEARKLAKAAAEEAWKVEEAERLARAEEARKIAQAKKVEDARRAAEAKQAKMAEEQARKLAAEAERLARAEEARKFAEAKVEEPRTAEGKVQISSPLTAAPGPAVSALPEQRHDPEPTAADPAPTAIIAQPTQSERLFNRGERNRTEGNIVIARQYFLRAAQMGLARAAFKLAETYDPYVQERVNVNADVPEAKKWYSRAVELGAEDAKARLAQWDKE